MCLPCEYFKGGGGGDGRAGQSTRGKSKSVSKPTTPILLFSLLLKVDKPPQLFSASDVKEITHWVNTAPIGYREVDPIIDCSSSHTVYQRRASHQTREVCAYRSFANLGSEKGEWVLGKLAGRLHKYSPFDVLTW